MYISALVGKNIAISKTRGLIKRETIARLSLELEIGMPAPVRLSFCTAQQKARVAASLPVATLFTFDLHYCQTVELSKPLSCLSAIRV